MQNEFFSPPFRWGLFSLVCAVLALGAIFIGRWAAYDFFHGSLTSVFLIKVLLDAGVLSQKKTRGESPLRKVE